MDIGGHGAQSHEEIKMSEKQMKKLRRNIRKKYGALERDKKGGRKTPSYQAYMKAKREKNWDLK